LQLPLCVYEYFLCRDWNNDALVMAVDLFVAIAR
jgi:hypothetical protein